MPTKLEFSSGTYRSLIRDPVGTLQTFRVTVGNLPSVPEGSQANVWFAASEEKSNIFIDDNRDRAWRMAQEDDAVQRGAIQLRMVVSGMRPSNLVPGQRHAATPIVYAGEVSANLWVTETQTGCTVLILRWSDSAYSMVHLQPSGNEQFNWFGRSLFQLDEYTEGWLPDHLFTSTYKNAWLKSEMTSVLGSTGSTGRKPIAYIMVQSLFETSRNRAVQVIGVRSGRNFDFYSQVFGAAIVRVEALRWSAWSDYLPWSAY